MFYAGAVDRNQSYAGNIAEYGMGCYSVCIMLLSIVGNVLAYRVNGLHVDEQYLVISQGMFAKKIKTIPYGKIQYITQKTGPLERLMHVKHANISILASAANRSNPIKSFPVSEFDKIHEYMKKTY